MTKGRVGHHPNRIEAESMQLDGYTPVDVTPWETASGGKAVACERVSGCSATFSFNGKTGHYDLATQYFDTNNGAAHFRLLVNGKQIDSWPADDKLPSAKMDGHTSTRHTTFAVALKPDDSIRIEGVPDGGDEAGLDYVEIEPSLSAPVIGIAACQDHTTQYLFSKIASFLNYVKTQLLWRVISVNPVT